MANKQLNNYIRFSNLTELGKYLNISRQTASNRIKARGWTGRLAFKESELEKLKTVAKSSANVKVNNELIEVLKEQVKTQNKTIEDLSEKLDHSQQLQAQAQNLADKLQTELSELKLIDKPEKLGFWRRIFFKNQD